MSLWGEEYIRKEVKKWLNYVEAAAAVKAEIVEKVLAAGLARTETSLAEAGIMLLQEAKSN